MLANDITWVSTIRHDQYEQWYKYAINTWNKLPGKKILFLDGEATVIPEVEVIDFWSIVDKEKSNWLSKKRKTKPHRFWFKGHTIHHAVKNKLSKNVIWIDADVAVQKEIPLELLDIKDKPLAVMLFQYMLIPQGESYGKGVESGLQIFNTQHPDMDEIIDYYYNFWESEEIFNFPKPYDTFPSTALIRKYDYENLVVDAHDKRYVGENSFIYTRFKDYLVHYLGKHNKDQIKTSA